MIIKGLFELVFLLLNVVFAPISLPDMPPAIQKVFDDLLAIFVGSLELLFVFFDYSVVKVLVPVVIVIINLDKVWSLIMFVLRKIPFLGIK